MSERDLEDILDRELLCKELLETFDKPVDLSTGSTDMSRKLLDKTIERAKKRLELTEEPALDLLRSPVGSLSI